MMLNVLLKEWAKFVVTSVSNRAKLKRWEQRKKLNEATGALALGELKEILATGRQTLSANVNRRPMLPQNVVATIELPKEMENVAWWIHKEGDSERWLID